MTPLEIRVIAARLSPAVPAAVTIGALKSPWVLQPVFARFSILSPSWLWVELPVTLALVVLLALGLSGRWLVRVRWVPAWRSATMGVAGLAKRLQSGRLDAYLLYMLIALVAVIAVVTTLA